MKIVKNGIHYNVHAYGGNIIGIIFRALINLRMSLYVDTLWKNVQAGRYEEDLFRIFDRCLDKKHCMIDAGAWRGPMSLYACQLAKHCYSVEPDPVAFLMLKENIALNPHIKNRITPCNVALLDHSGSTIISAQFSFDQTWTSTTKTYSGSHIKIPSLTFPDFIKKYNIADCNFIKMDTEAAEALILPLMRDYLKRFKPAFFISFHPNRFPDLEKGISAVIDTVKLYRYSYDPKGNELNADFIRKKLQNKNKFDILLTDKKWT